MARNLQPQEPVYVALSRLGLDLNGPSALYKTHVEEVNGRSVRVLMAGGGISELIASSAVHRNVGVLIFRIGDFQTEDTLLDPLAKSVLQYFRLLLPDDSVRFFEVRSLLELSHYWQTYHGGYSHVILIGHGDETNGILFAVDQWKTCEELGAVLTVPNTIQKTFVSLCCSTGYAAFGQNFSRLAPCGAFIAPFHSVHGAVASQFCQTFFAYHLLQGETIGVAFKHARKAIPGSSIFRLWQQGRMIGDS